ncbi:MAG: Trp biosynthesis-associated membrane protein, partial [Angustibacter sp.]
LFRPRHSGCCWMLSPNRAGSVVAALALEATLLWLAAKPWLTAQGRDPLRGPVDVVVSGADSQPWIPALVLVLVAATLILGLYFAKNRILSAGSLAIGGLILGAGIAVQLRQPSVPRSALPIGLDPASLADPVATAWAWAALGVSLLVALLGLALLRQPRSGVTGRPGGGPGESTEEPAPLDPISAWESLNRGVDPTSAARG